ncbi:tyrosine-type recombinase/integrase [Micromonospora sp. NPDC050980]|uniref:tyrosine-type recombinase/integrase n=1 Tax=Micromonospora sp. NPDC050980 TaxID=3155161 RepID=UPI0033E876CC
MSLAVVRSLRSTPHLSSAQEFEDFEQELVDQYALAGVGAGHTDGYVAQERGVLFAFVRFLGRPVWTATVSDGDRFLAHLRKDRGLSHRTVHGRALMLGRFFDFLMSRYQGEIYAKTGHVLEQPIDHFNRPNRAEYATLTRVPPSDDEVDQLFGRWGEALPDARKYLPATRDYLAASLWRRVGLRISETLMLDIRDWRPDLGEHGRLHVRFGKGSMGKGPKTRLVPGINDADALLDWWLTDVRHQFDADYGNPDAPLLPSERRDQLTGLCRRTGDDALRTGLAAAVRQWLPAWQGRLTPHVLRHYCASSLYARGMDLKAIQELLGHEWLSTTTRYIHVHDNHVEHAWNTANDRVAARLSLDPR